WAPDGSTLATVGRDRVVRLWDTRTGKERTFAGRTGPLLLPGDPIRWHDPELGGSDRPAPYVWRLGGLGYALADILEQLRTRSALASPPDGRTLAALSDGEVKLWDAATGREWALPKEEASGDPFPPGQPRKQGQPPPRRRLMFGAIAFAPDGK